jgi:hypothetical protein
MNAINTIFPYKINGTWFFDDESTGLKREAFVCGTSELIDVLVKGFNVPNAESGFKLTFSANPFPEHNDKVVWLKEDEYGMGNWFVYENLYVGKMEFWLCPAMYHYLNPAPKEIYVKVESLNK